MEQNQDIPLCVDLDGTLVKTDTLVEAILSALKTNPLIAFALPVWLLGGKSHFKKKVSSHANLDAATLPYQQTFLKFLQAEHASGRTLILVTAADRSIATRVADHLGIFSSVYATDGGTNLAGKNKGHMLRDLFGSKNFEYAGNESRDLHVWEHAIGGIAVNTPKGIIRRARAMTDIHTIFEDRPHFLRAIASSLRIHQWVKNFLIFVPIVMAHAFLQPVAILSGLIAFFSFSFAASAVYILNDLLDLFSDRRHPIKRHRPLAAGNVSILLMILIAGSLLFGSIYLAEALSAGFVLTLAIYLIVTTFYSFYLKQVVLLDVIVLASLYTLRIVAGTVAAGVIYSSWLLGFSMFLFFSLALLKRYGELTLLMAHGGEHSLGRGYVRGDQSILSQLGIGSGLIAVLVLALYVNSDQVTALYHTPLVLWLMCPVMLFWVGRMWMLAHRGRLHDDPILFALRDPPSYIVGILAAGIVFLAT